MEEGAVGEAGAQARAAVAEIFGHLQPIKAVDAGDELFPNGIDLIEVEVSIGSADKPLFKISAKIEGPETKPGAFSGEARQPAL